MCSDGTCRTTFPAMVERYLRETVAADSPVWTAGRHRRPERETGPLDGHGTCFFCGRSDLIVAPWDPPELPQAMCNDCFEGYEYEHGYLDGIEDVVLGVVLFAGDDGARSACAYLRREIAHLSWPQRAAIAELACRGLRALVGARP